MPRSLIGVKEVAASLHVSTREVVRMAEKQILPAVKVKGAWQFRAGDIWNWIEENVHSLADRRAKDRHPSDVGELLIANTLKEHAIDTNLVAKTKSSVIRSLASLAEKADPYLDESALVDQLMERESQGSTALEHGVAVPHPARPFYSEGPVLAAARTAQGIVFGERRGGLSDLFFLVCCPDQVNHLLYFGRLCRLLIDPALRQTLRHVEDSAAFLEAIREAEFRICEER